MNQIMRKSRGWMALVASLAWTSLAFAQQQAPSVDVNVNSGGAVWYGQWWVWAMAVAVFLIVVIALTNRGGRSEV